MTKNELITHMQEFMTILTDDLKDMIENEGPVAGYDVDFEQGYIAGYTKALMTVEDNLNE
jgi:hypothetical protein